MRTLTAESDTADRILGAARERLLSDGYAGLSTRKVASQAGVPVSQVHYHFGSKGAMVLALLESENQRRLDRQARMYAEDVPMSRRYEQACDLLDEDLDSGFVASCRNSSQQVGRHPRSVLRPGGCWPVGMRC